MKTVLSKRFKKDYKRLPKHIKESFKKQMQFLNDDPNHPSLDMKKMQDPRNIWRIKLSEGFRLTFQIKKDVCFLRRIGSHDIEKKP